MTIHQSTASAAVKAAALPKHSKTGARSAGFSIDSDKKHLTFEQKPAQSAIKTKEQAAKPRDVLDCIAAGIPRADWESALDHNEARQWSAWLGEKRPESGLLNEATQAKIKTQMLRLSDELWHLDAARSALNAVATMTDQCAFYAGSTLAVSAQDMAHLLRVVHAEMERRTQEITSAVEEVNMVWRVKA